MFTFVFNGNDPITLEDVLFSLLTFKLLTLIIPTCISAAIAVLLPKIAHKHIVAVTPPRAFFELFNISYLHPSVYNSNIV